MGYKIYCDGAATMRKINGEYVRENGGWAYTIIDENFGEIVSEYGGQKNTTNNAMELMAILKGLQKYLELDYNEQSIEICSDSAYCVNIFSNWINNWKNNNWTRGKKHEPIENVNIIKEIDQIIEDISRRHTKVIFVKVKGHSIDLWNNYVDSLAVKGKKEVESQE